MTNVEPRTTTLKVARRVAVTVVAWIAAYAVVTVVILVGGRSLAEAPRYAQTLVVSGTLVIVMVNVVMPSIARLVTRLFGFPNPKSP